MSANPDWSKFDTEMFRTLYRQLRSNTVQMGGGNNKHFDEACRLELEFRGMNPTPQNWVICAMEIEREAHMQDMYENQDEAEIEAERQQVLYENYLEDKYDFSKEN